MCARLSALTSSIRRRNRARADNPGRAPVSRSPPPGHGSRLQSRRWRSTAGWPALPVRGNGLVGTRPYRVHNIACRRWLRPPPTGRHCRRDGDRCGAASRAVPCRQREVPSGSGPTLEAWRKARRRPECSCAARRSRVRACAAPQRLWRGQRRSRLCHTPPGGARSLRISWPAL